MELKKYDSYKDSGVEWIGEIPSHWKIKRLKFFAKICNGQDHKEVNQEDGQYPIYGSGGIFGRANQFLYEGPSVLLGRKGTIDKPNFVDIPFWTVDTAYFTKILPENDPKYFYYLCTTINFEEYKYGSAIPSMTQSTLNNIEFLSPPFYEQQKLANYLDHKTSQIDDLIAKKERLIQLLEEERTAIINQAVTKGLDPNVPMKYSGIEWLGEIPEHWEVKKLRFLADIIPSGIDKKSKEEEEEVLLCNYVDVYKNDFITPNMEFMKATASDAQIEKLTLKKYDVIATKDSEDPNDIGVPALVLDDINGVVCGYHLTLFRAFDDNEFGRFLFWFLKSKMCSQYFSTLARGITRYALGSNAFKNLTISLPMTKTEIHKIANYLDAKTKEIETIILNTKQEIELLKEYKTALISEVVTGKVDVRDYSKT